MYTPFHFVSVALHHGLIAMLAGLAGCAVLRAIQARVGSLLGLEVRLPAPRYGLWAASAFGIGVLGAGTHWLLFGARHSPLDLTIVWLMACGNAFLAWLALDRRYTQDRRMIAAFAVLSALGFLIFADVWRPERTDWLGMFEANDLLIASVLIAFPRPARPKRPKKPKKPKPGGRKKTYDPGVIGHDTGLLHSDPGIISFDPED